MGPARIALLVAAILLTATACGAQQSSEKSSEGRDSPQSRYAGERERLLATCPAKAQGFFAWQQELADKKGLERPVDENDVSCTPPRALRRASSTRCPRTSAPGS